MAVGGQSHVPATLPPGKETGYPFYRGWVGPRNGLNIRTYMHSLTVTGKFSEIYGGQSGFGTGFSASASVFPCQYHPTSAPYSSSSTCCSYRTDKQAKIGNLPKYENNVALENKELWVEKYFHVVSQGLKWTFKNGLRTGLILFWIDQWLAIVITPIGFRVPCNNLNFLTN